MTSVQQDFFNKVWPLCLQASTASKKTPSSHGVFPEIIFAQAALESGYGLHHPGNNFFGIKAGPSTDVSASTDDQTTEYINGVAVRLAQHFAGYPSMASSFLGYATFIRHNRRYSAFDAGGSISSQLVALGTSGYATDPNYAMKIGSIVDLVPTYLANSPYAGAQAKGEQPSAPTSKPEQPPMTAKTPPANIFAQFGHDFDQDMNGVKATLESLTAHKTGLQIATQIASAVLPFAPIPAPAASAITGVLNGLNNLAKEPAPEPPVAPAPPAGTGAPVIEPPAQTGSEAPAALDPALATTLQDALVAAEDLFPELYTQYKSGTLNIETGAVDVVEEAAKLFNPQLGIAKDPTAN